jgi:hypothetical protein
MINKQDIIDFYVSFKDTIEFEIAKPLEDSLVGITADNAYIAGLQTALRLADESARYVIDKIKELTTPAPEPQESVDADGWNNNFAEAPQDYDTPILIKYYCDWKKCERVTVGHYSENPDCPEEDGFYTWYETGCIGESNKVKNLISWQLLPTGDNE